MKLTKQSIFALTACMILGCSFANFPVSAMDTSYGDLSFELMDSYISINGCRSDATVVEIPDSIDGYPVEMIGREAFAGCTDLTSVSIPSSVTKIAKNAFQGCDALETITVDANNEAFQTVDGVLFQTANSTLWCYPSAKADSVYTVPEGTTRIIYEGFGTCPNLTELVLPASLQQFSFSVSAFYPHELTICDALTTITVAEENPYYQSIDGVLFSDDGLRLFRYPAGRQDESYSVPASVTSIEGNAFFGSDDLVSVTCSENLDVIFDGAFYACENLQSIALPDTMTSIGEEAFAFCTNLTSVNLPDTLTELGSYAFASCNNLKELNLSSGLTVISEGILQDCGELCNLIIPEGCTSIDAYALDGCRSLTAITIPASVTEIGSSAFKNCINLTDVYYGGTESEWNTINVAMGNSPLNNPTIHYQSAASADCGDLDGNRIINASDAAVLLMAAAVSGSGADSGLTDAQIAAADLNADGALDAQDAALILQYAAYMGTGGTMSLTNYLAAL